MSDLKLLKFPTTSDERIQRNIDRLAKELWESEDGEHVIEILRICEEYVLCLEDDVETSLALVNLQTTIILLEKYFNC